MTQADWGADWTERIGSQVLKWRKRRGLSAQRLADRCAELGMPVSRNTIANLEPGKPREPGKESGRVRRKETVTVQEVAVLAAALDVPPVALLFPLELDEVDVLPGEAVPVFGAVQWWAGEAAGTEGAVAAYDEGVPGEPLRMLEDLRALARDGARVSGPDAGAWARVVIMRRERLRAAGASVPRHPVQQVEDQLRELESLPEPERDARLTDAESRDLERRGHSPQAIGMIRRATARREDGRD